MRNYVAYFDYNIVFLYLMFSGRSLKCGVSVAFRDVDFVCMKNAILFVVYKYVLVDY